MEEDGVGMDVIMERLCPQTIDGKKMVITIGTMVVVVDTEDVEMEEEEMIGEGEEGRSRLKIGLNLCQEMKGSKRSFLVQAMVHLVSILTGIYQFLI